MKNLLGDSHEEYINSVRKLVEPGIGLADAELIAAKGHLRLYRLPSGQGVVLNNKKNTTTLVDIESTLSHDGYWRPVPKQIEPDPQISLSDAKLIGINNSLRLYVLPSGRGAVHNTRTDTITEVNVDSVLLRGYWTPAEEYEQE